MSDIVESYQRIGEQERKFDIAFWQAQGAEAVFEAAYEMLLDSLIVRGTDVTEPGLQKSVESYGKI